MSNSEDRRRGRSQFIAGLAVIDTCKLPGGASLSSVHLPDGTVMTTEEYFGQTDRGVDDE